MTNRPRYNILQTIWRFLARRQPEPVLDETALDETVLKEQLISILSIIAVTFFNSLALLQAEKREFASSLESKAQAKENALSDFHDELDKGIVKYLNGG